MSFTYRTSADSSEDRDTLNVVAVDVEHAVKLVKSTVNAHRITITEVDFANNVHIHHIHES